MCDEITCRMNSNSPSIPSKKTHNTANLSHKMNFVPCYSGVKMRDKFTPRNSKDILEITHTKKKKTVPEIIARDETDEKLIILASHPLFHENLYTIRWNEFSNENGRPPP